MAIMKIDKACLDYLLEVATQIGFSVRSVDITEGDDRWPTFTMSCIQKREVDLQSRPVVEPSTETENQRPTPRKPHTFATLDD